MTDYAQSAEDSIISFLRGCQKGLPAASSARFLPLSSSPPRPHQKSGHLVTRVCSTGSSLGVLLLFLIKIFQSAFQNYQLTEDLEGTWQKPSIAKRYIVRNLPPATAGQPSSFVLQISPRSETNWAEVNQSNGRLHKSLAPDSLHVLHKHHLLDPFRKVNHQKRWCFWRLPKGFCRRNLEKKNTFL